MRCDTFLPADGGALHRSSDDDVSGALWLPSRNQRAGRVFDLDDRRSLIGTIGGWLRGRHLAFAFRLVLGTTLLVSGITKMPDMVGFADDVVAHEILPDVLAHAYGLLLPWLEGLLGTLLFIGLLTRWAAGASLLVVVSFVVYNAMSLGSWAYVTPGDCGCFGSWVSLSSWEALAIDVAMAVALVPILVHRGEYLSADGLLRRRRRRAADRRRGDRPEY